MRLRELSVDVVRSFRRHGLINFASAMSFQTVVALVPFLLFLAALLGFLDLEELWRRDVAPTIRDNVSEPAYRLISQSVEQVLGAEQVWWLTAGLLLTLWQLAAATRITMTAIDRIYGYERRRGFFELLPRSLLLGAAIGLSVVAAFAIVRFGPLLTGDLDGLLAVLSFLARWSLAALVLGLGVGLTVRYGGGMSQRLPSATLGTALVLVAWVVTSIAFGAYVQYVASYQTVFGHLANFYLLFVYVFLASNAFLVGLQLDACMRERP